MSFVRSRGTRGASVETLRGTTGADFEGNAQVVRGQSQGAFCGCWGGKTDKLRFVLIKGPFCFVFTDEEAPSPKYAINLVHMRARAEEHSYGHTAVLLETSLGDVEYQFIFDISEDEDAPQRFVSVVSEQAVTAEAELVKKRLGHEHLLQKRSSVRYAETIATKKIKEQPEAPITATEVMESVPVPGY